MPTQNAAYGATARERDKQNSYPLESLSAVQHQKTSPRHSWSLSNLLGLKNA